MPRKRPVITVRMAIMQAMVSPIVIERIPAPINKACPSPYTIHITQPDIAIGNNIINYTRVVFWNIHIFFTSRLNPDIIVNFNFYLIIAIQIAILVSHLAHTLNSIHHIGFLHFNRLAQLLCPSRIFRQLTKYIRKRD